jgi:hypothetical protein
MHTALMLQQMPHAHCSALSVASGLARVDACMMRGSEHAFDNAARELDSKAEDTA